MVVPKKLPAREAEAEEWQARGVDNPRVQGPSYVESVGHISMRVSCTFSEPEDFAIDGNWHVSQQPRQRSIHIVSTCQDAAENSRVNPNSSQHLGAVKPEYDLSNFISCVLFVSHV